MRCWPARGAFEFGVFEDPGVFVEEEDGVEAGGEGGVDVAFGAVADHPAWCAGVSSWRATTAR